MVDVGYSSAAVDEPSSAIPWLMFGTLGEQEELPTPVAAPVERQRLQYFALIFP